MTSEKHSVSLLLFVRIQISLTGEEKKRPEKKKNHQKQTEKPIWQDNLAGVKKTSIQFQICIIDVILFYLFTVKYDCFT